MFHDSHERGYVQKGMRVNEELKENEVTIMLRKPIR